MESKNAIKPPQHTSDKQANSEIRGYEHPAEPIQYGSQVSKYRGARSSNSYASFGKYLSDDEKLTIVDNNKYMPQSGLHGGNNVPDNLIPQMPFLKEDVDQDTERKIQVSHSQYQPTPQQPHSQYQPTPQQPSRTNYHPSPQQQFQPQQFQPPPPQQPQPPQYQPPIQPSFEQHGYTAYPNGYSPQPEQQLTTPYYLQPQQQSQQHNSSSPNFTMFQQPTSSTNVVYY